MATLRPLLAASLVLAVSCATVPVPAVRPPSPVEAVQAVSPPSRGPVAGSIESWQFPRPLDLDHWPFGWVDDGEGPRLGHSPRFWSDHKALWTEALDPSIPPARAARRLESAYRSAGSAEEAFRAAWRLWLTYGRAGLADDARSWLDRASERDPANSVLLVARLWDQAFRLGDLSGARSLWPGTLTSLGADDARKAGLLRQKLFLGTQGLAAAGGDGYVSALTLDRDDLWAATWNGAVVRWSLVTGELTGILAPARVAPVNRLVVTSWFVYAFQDQALVRYSKVTGTWRSFPYPTGWTGLRVTGALAEGEESLTASYLGQGLWRWTQGTWTLVDDQGGGPFVTALASDGEGGYVVGTKDRGLWLFRNGVWTNPGAGGPTNISTVVARVLGGPWAVGTWGEGAWVYDGKAVSPILRGRQFVTAAAWTSDGPLWGTLDEGVVATGDSGTEVLGPRDGVGGAGVSALAVWQGRWIWGTTGQGLGWWSEHEDPALLR